MISVPSTTAPQAKGASTGATGARLNSQTAGFGDMLQVLLMALVPAGLVESMEPAPQPDGQATGSEPGSGGNTGSLDPASGGSNAKVGGWAGDIAWRAMPESGWFAVPRPAAHTATDVIGAASGQASGIPVTGGKAALVDLAALRLLEAARTLAPIQLAQASQAPADAARPAKGSIEDALLDALTPSGNGAGQAGSDTRPSLLTGSSPAGESAARRAAKGSAAAGVTRQPGAVVGLPKIASAILTGGDGPLTVLWKSISGCAPEATGSPGRDGSRLGGLGQGASTPAVNVSSGGALPAATSGQGSDGTSLNGGSSYPQYAPGQGEVTHRVAADLSAKFDLGSLGLSRPDVPAGDLVRPAAVPSGHDAGGTGMQAQAVFEAVADRAQVARLRGENLARFELATNDGNTIRVRISVHDNVVSARIDVTSAALRDVLAQHAPELSQRLQAGGLVPEAIQVSLLGGRETGSERHDRRQESGRSGGYHEIDAANLTLIETDDVGFERWA